MLKAGLKAIFVFIIVIALYTCIDPYTPKLRGYNSLLVVDGLITNANTSYTIKLSRTFQDQNSNPSMVTGADIFITDDAGNSSHLINKGNGIYATDSIEFIGAIGRTYVLHIVTQEGEEYESDPCLLQSVPDIDSIYFGKDMQLVNNGTESQEGVSIYLDSKGGDNNQYYRWTFDETWKFKVPDPKTFNYVINPNDPDNPFFIPIESVNDSCWKSSQSGEILIRSVNEGEPGKIEKQPISFIATAISDRLLIQYNILVKQYSISKEEYEFWNNLKQVNESSGDIFAKQPFEVKSNLRNVNNPEERVLGFFQVSAEKQKRKDIIFNDVVGLDLPFYQVKCERFVKERGEFSLGPGAPPPTWDDVYKIFCINSDYYFVEPLYFPGTVNKLEYLVFARPECANCELSGTRTRPDFWVDLK